MQFENYEKHVARHGIDPRRWPDPQLAEIEPVKSWLETDRTVQFALMGRPTPPLSANFQDQVIGALPAAPKKYVRIGSIAAAALACLFAGTLFLQTPSQDVEWQNAAEEAGLGDIYDWVMDEDLTL